MKFSIITVCFNSAQTIADAVLSVKEQKGVEFEHIIVDGGSSDATISEILLCESNKAVLISERDNGIYDAMNKGLALASGDVIGILNSDDVFASPFTLRRVLDVFQSNPEFDAVTGAVEFFERDFSSSVVRRIPSRPFKKFLMRFGWMPPHTGTFLRSHIIESVGEYDIRYNSAADFDYFFRAFYLSDFSLGSVDSTLVNMRMGGVSTRGFESNLLTTREILISLRRNGVSSCFLLLLIRLPFKYLSERLVYDARRFFRRFFNL